MVMLSHTPRPRHVSEHAAEMPRDAGRHDAGSLFPDQGRVAGFTWHTRAGRVYVPFSLVIGCGYSLDAMAVMHRALCALDVGGELPPGVQIITE